MGIITTEQLENAAQDAETLEDVVNGSATLNTNGTVTTRLGQVLKTLAKIESDINEVGEGWLAQAEAAATKLSGTSDTEITIGTGSKEFTTQSGKNFSAGTWLLITSDADPANYMHGTVTSYSGTTLTVNITNIGGSGTLDDWTIQVSGTRGATGAPGSVSNGDKVDIEVTDDGATWTIKNGVVSLVKLAVQAANTFLANATADSASPTAIALSTNQLVGRGASGNISAITLGAGLSMTGAELNTVGTGIASVHLVKFTSSGTYTAPSNLLFADVELVGGGAGGRNGGSSRGGPGGGAGGYSRRRLTAAEIGESRTVTIGAGGAVASSGGTTSFGSLLSATGGAAAGGSGSVGGDGGVGSSGDINLAGGMGGSASGDADISSQYYGGGSGGSSFFGGSGSGAGRGAGSNGAAGKVNTGGGGGGGNSTTGSSFTDGAAGGSGIVIITEYRSA
jgi:hypothetical protein